MFIGNFSSCSLFSSFLYIFLFLGAVNYIPLMSFRKYFPFPKNGRRKTKVQEGEKGRKGEKKYYMDVTERGRVTGS